MREPGKAVALGSLDAGNGHIQRPVRQIGSYAGTCHHLCFDLAAAVLDQLMTISLSMPVATLFSVK
jgi:hypothetical protein